MKNPPPKVLGLSSEELRVIETVANLELSHSEISRKSGLPRTSVVRTVRKLAERGLVVQRKASKSRARYALAEDGELSRRIDEARVFLNPSLSIFSVPHFDGLRVYKGVESMVGLHVQLLAAQPKHTRVRAIQPNRSFLSMYDAATVEQIAEFNKAISESRVILDGVIEENAYQEYERYWKLDPEGFERLNPTFLNRTTDYTTVRPGAIPFSTELWIYFDTVVIGNWRDKQAIAITDPNARAMLECLYETLKATGRKIDPAVEIKKLDPQS